MGNLSLIINNLAGLLIILKPSKEVLQWLSNVREIIDKALVEVAKFKENLNILIRSRLGPFRYNFNINQIHSNVLFINNKA